MKNLIHAVAGSLAMLLIALFLSSTLYAELFADHELITQVKRLIVFPGLFVLIPCLIATGGSGYSLANGRKGRLISAKKKRMPFIALNGILVLVPCAIFLSFWAGQGRFDLIFYSVQAIELLAGTINLTLMSLNLRDGLTMAGRRGRSAPITPA